MVKKLKTGCISGNCDNGSGVYVFTDGAQYNGEWKDGKRHGKGIIVWSNGSSYEGQFYENYMHGKGVHTREDGSKFDGYFEQNKEMGVGTYYNPNGTIVVKRLNDKDGKVTLYSIIVNKKPVTVEIQHSIADKHIKKMIKEISKTGKINKLFIKQFLELLTESLNSIVPHRSDVSSKSLLNLLSGCTGWEGLKWKNGFNIIEE